MSQPKVSIVGRMYYFTIPEQQVIYNSMKLYIEKYPDSKEAQLIKKDFYRTSFE